MMGLYTTWYNNGSVEQSEDLYSFGDVAITWRVHPKTLKREIIIKLPLELPVEQQIQFIVPKISTCNFI